MPTKVQTRLIDTPAPVRPRSASKGDAIETTKEPFAQSLRRATRKPEAPASAEPSTKKRTDGTAKSRIPDAEAMARGEIEPDDATAAASPPAASQSTELPVDQDPGEKNESDSDSDQSVGSPRSDSISPDLINAAAAAVPISPDPVIPAPVEKPSDASTAPTPSRAVALDAPDRPAGSGDMAFESASEQALSMPDGAESPAASKNTNAASGTEKVVAPPGKLKLSGDKMPSATPDPQGSGEQSQMASGDSSRQPAQAVTNPLAGVQAAPDDAASQVASNGRATKSMDASTPLDPGVSAAAKPSQSSSVTTAKPAAVPTPPQTPEERFVADNMRQIASSMRAELNPHGGTMRLRLDPPELGALQVRLEMRDGVMTASLLTSNDEAARLLGHSLNQLRDALQGQGMVVDRIRVEQSPRDLSSQTPDDGQGDRSGEQSQARQEQQRQQMLRRLWQRLSGDPLDLVA